MSVSVCLCLCSASVFVIVCMCLCAQVRLSHSLRVSGWVGGCVGACVRDCCGVVFTCLHAWVYVGIQAG